MEKNKSMVCILIDFQEKLFQHMDGKEALLDSAEKLVQGLNLLKIPIIWNEQYPKGLGATVGQISRHLACSEPIIKNTFSCCDNDAFNRKLAEHQNHHILLFGIEAHVCIYQTGRDLLSSGYTVDIISDCVSSRKKQDKETALRRLEMLGAGILSTEMILFDLLQTAEGDVFKSISKLVK